MDSFIKSLRKLGPLGTALANVLTLITTNWPLAMSAIVAIWTALSDWAFGLASNARLHVAVLVFLALLWTFVGITVLIDRRRPRSVRTHPDYRYGLTFEGINPNIDAQNDVGWLTFGIQLRNFSQAPILVRFDHFDVRIGTRAIPKATQKNVTGYLPRGGGRVMSVPPFKKEDVKEFFGKRVTGTAEFAILYGHPESEPVRKLRMTIDITLGLPAEEAQPALVVWGADIVQEIDEEYEG